MDIKLEIRDLKSLFRRRKRSFIVPFLLTFSMAVAVSYILKPIYQSEATILVEGQKISDDYVTTTTTSFVEERIASITREIMTHKSLMEIINQFDLYSEMRKKYTATEISRKFKDDITLETIDTDVYNRKSGRQAVTTIAFTLSYRGTDPKVVKLVTDKLASLYVDADFKERESQAASTTLIFENELENLKARIAEHEEKISKFKKFHFMELPEHNAINIQTLAELEKDYERLNIQLRTLRGKKTNLEGNLAGVDPSATAFVNEKNMLLNPKDRLKQLRIQLMDLQSTLSDKHPDIKRLKKAIQELEIEENNFDDRTLKLQRLSEIKDQLAVLESKYGPRHPDVVNLSKETLQIEDDLRRKKFFDSASEKADNPAYLNLQTQIIGVETEIQALEEEKKKISKDIETYRKIIANAPQVEREWSELTRDYESAKQRYIEISDNLMKAKFARGMDESSIATSFRILEPAYIPQKPSKPNRMTIGLMGFFIAIAFSFTFAVFREYSDTSIKTKEELSRLTGIPVFAVIPFVESRRNRYPKKTIWAFTILIMTFATFFLIHRYLSPIGLLW